MANAPLILVSGPSGSGKSTIVRRLLEEGELPLRASVSATTRAPRRGEVNGVHYWFWTHEQFEEGLREEAFLEWAEVHGQFYGTLRSEVDPYLARGTGVILEIDVQGADRVRALYPECCSIFLCASSWAEYERRLRARGTEDEAAIARRLDTARRELARASEYDHRVINDDLAAAVAHVRRIVAGLFPTGGATTCSTT